MKERDPYEDVRRALEKIIRRLPLARFHLQNDRDDIVNEATTKAWTYLGSRIEEGGFIPASYLGNTAASVFWDRVRREYRRRHDVSLDDLESYWDDGDREGGGALAKDRVHLSDPTLPDPERATLSAEVRRAFVDCLECLLPDRSRALVLSLLGHPIKEAAAILGFDYKKTDNLIARGRADIRVCLERKGLGR